MKKLINGIWNLIVTCWNNDVLRYIFIGGCTTMVNLVSYYLLRTFTAINMNVANAISKIPKNVLKIPSLPNEIPK